MQWKKIGIVVAVLFAITLCVAGVFHFWLPKTPEFALYKTAVALKNHNYEEFEEFVDIESVVNNFVDESVASVRKEVIKSGDSPTFADNFAEGLLHMMKPALVSAAKAQVKLTVEKGLHEKGLEVKFDKPDLFDIAFKQKYGDIAIKKLASTDKKATFRLSREKQTLDIKLTNKKDGWMITSVKLNA